MKDDLERAIHITSWSGGSITVHPALAPDAASVLLPFVGEEQRYTGGCFFPTTGIAVFEVVSSRSIRLWLGETLVLDEELDWRSYQREIRAVVLFPCEQ